MTPNFTWRGEKDQQNCIPLTKDNTVLYPQRIPFGEACWSHVDYVGEFVNLPFLLHVLNGNLSYVKKESGKEEAKVIFVSCI